MLESRIKQQEGRGQPIPEKDRTFFEQRFNHDFSQVYTHTDAEADKLNQELKARAFTYGRDIYFGQGEYTPGSTAGRKLLAHELTHVIQQGEGDDRSQCKLVVGKPGDVYEQEADRTAQSVIHMWVPDNSRPIPDNGRVRSNPIHRDIMKQRVPDLQCLSTSLCGWGGGFKRRFLSLNTEVGTRFAIHSV